MVFATPTRFDQARTAGADAMLAVVLPRYPRESPTVLREARAAGLAVVVKVLLQAMCDADPEPAQRRLEEFEAVAGRRQIFVG